MNSVAASISPNDKSVIQRVLKKSGSVNILAASMARLYLAYPVSSRQWTYSKLMGAIVLLKDLSDGPSFFFKLVDLQNAKLIWEHELYNDIPYKQERSYFHTFPADYCMVAFSFSNEDEARLFFLAVCQRCGDFSSPVRRAKVKKSLLSTFRSLGRGNRDEDEDEIQESDISAPTDFQHLYHVGYHPDTGFDLKNIPPDWKAIFERAGVTQSQLRDKNTASFIYQFMQTNAARESRPVMNSTQTTMSPVTVSSFSPSSRPPPTTPSHLPPLPVHSSVPARAPPPPPPPPSASTGPSVILSPPAPTVPIANVQHAIQMTSPSVPPAVPASPLLNVNVPLAYTPRPPPVAAPIEESTAPITPNRSDLLASIQKSNISNLRKVEANEERVSSPPATDMATALARALAERSKVLQHSDDELDDDDNEW